jgi:hypothetical protein
MNRGAGFPPALSFFGDARRMPFKMHPDYPDRIRNRVPIAYRLLMAGSIAVAELPARDPASRSIPTESENAAWNEKLRRIVL